MFFPSLFRHMKNDSKCVFFPPLTSLPEHLTTNGPVPMWMFAVHKWFAFRTVVKSWYKSQCYTTDSDHFLYIYCYNYFMHLCAFFFYSQWQFVGKDANYSINTTQYNTETCWSFLSFLENCIAFFHFLFFCLVYRSTCLNCKKKKNEFLVQTCKLQPTIQKGKHTSNCTCSS